MDALCKQRLCDAGIAVDDALARFLGNESLMLRFLGRFVQDNSFDQLTRAIAEGDAEAAFFAAHTLKGVVGNLSMKTLYTVTSEMVEDLRRKDLRAAEEKLPALQTQYQVVVQALNALQNN